MPLFLLVGSRGLPDTMKHGLHLRIMTAQCDGHHKAVTAAVGICGRIDDRR
jgi:hypothetical protein